MDSDGLPIVGPGIDYTKVGAIHQKRTLAFLNHFITHTVRFLNHFSCVCEEKLETMTVRLQRLETTMNLLEAKLSSIPGLENVTAPVQTTSNVAQSQTGNTAPSQPTPAPDVQISQLPPDQAPPPSSSPPEPSQPEKPKNTVAQDPRYMKYFKLMQVGVPPMAFKGKMLAEGLDPDLLETPDAAVPVGAKTEESNKTVTQDTQDSDTDFSDEDKDNENKENNDDDSSGFSD